jgi:hypothetical protein
MKIKLLLLNFIFCKFLFAQVINDSLTVSKLGNDISNASFNISYTYSTVPSFIKKGIKKIEGKKFCIADKVVSITLQMLILKEHYQTIE